MSPTAENAEAHASHAVKLGFGPEKRGICAGAPIFLGHEEEICRGNMVGGCWTAVIVRQERKRTALDQPRTEPWPIWQVDICAGGVLTVPVRFISRQWWARVQTLLEIRVAIDRYTTFCTTRCSNLDVNGRCGYRVHLCSGSD